MHRRSTVGGTSQSESGTHVVWVAWRQQRFQVLASLSLIGAVALGLVFLRLNVVGALQDAGAQDCGNIAAFCASPGFDSVSDRYGAVAAIVPLIMLVLPPLLGAFAGGPLFAREYEQGTQILALTQSVGPVRWWATKTAVAGAPVALALLALGFVNTWAMQPMAAFVARPMITPGFETRGLTPSAYFVLAFAIAVTVGILVRNTAAAIGATIGLYIACLLVLGFLRPSYLAPVDLVEAFPPVTGTAEPMDANFIDAWVVDEYFVDASGNEVTLGTGECSDSRNAMPCLIEHGVAGYLYRYQPVDRYWSIQAVESVIAVLAGAAILAVGALRLRRRVT